MQLRSRSHVVTVWITIASLLALLWSGMAHARAGNAVEASAWNEICSVGGNAKVDPKKAAQEAHFQHCALCCKLGSAAALPSRFDFPLPPAGAVRATAIARALPTLPTPHWPAAPPRGPPA